MPDIAALLTAALGESGMLTGEDVTSRSAGIWGPARRIEAQILARPDSVEGVSQVLAICNAHRQPVVVHGGLTGVVDGARVAIKAVVAVRGEAGRTSRHCAARTAAG